MNPWHEARDAVSTAVSALAGVAPSGEVALLVRIALAVAQGAADSLAEGEWEKFRNSPVLQHLPPRVDAEAVIAAEHERARREIEMRGADAAEGSR